MDDVRISATLAADGSLATDEHLGYTFPGDFTPVFRDIPFEPGTAVVVTGVTGPDGAHERLPSGWTPFAGPPITVTPARDMNPSPWSSTAPRQRTFSYYRVTTA